MEKTAVKPGKVCQSPASRWGRASEAPFNTVLGIPGAVFLFLERYHLRRLSISCWAPRPVAGIRSVQRNRNAVSKTRHSEETRRVDVGISRHDVCSAQYIDE